MQQLTKQYLKQIRLLMPVYGSRERAYLKKLLYDVDEYVIEHAEGSSLYELYEVFGSPAEIEGNYIITLDTNQLLRRLSKRNLFICFFIVIISSFCVFSCFYFWTKYQTQLAINRMDQIMEEGEDPGALPILNEEGVIYGP